MTQRLLASGIPEWILLDRELGPGVWLLTSGPVAGIAAPFVNLEATSKNSVVAWEALERASRSWSHGERIYALVALHFWNGWELPRDCQPYQWSLTLSEHNREPLIEAMRLAAGLAEV